MTIFYCEHGQRVSRKSDGTKTTTCDECDGGETNTEDRLDWLSLDLSGEKPLKLEDNG